MPSKYNQQQVEVIKDKIAQAKSVAIVDYSGTNANDQVKLRQVIREAGGEMFVAKNTLVKLALNKDELNNVLTGMNALILSQQDAVSALKAVFEFHQDQEKLDIKSGLMVEDDRVLTADEVKQLSQLPGMDELIISLIRQVQAPAYGLVNVLKGTQRSLVYALQAIADQKQATA